MIKERPILFSTPMLQAVLDGRKTMTRRVIKPQPPHEISDIFCDNDYFPTIIDRRGIEQPGPKTFGAYDEYGEWGVKCPFPPGTRLWVKENLIRIPWADGIDGIAYAADNEPAWDMTRPCRWVWKKNSLSSMFMPRNLARILLEVTNVRVERVQEITEEDAIAEGFEPVPCFCSERGAYGCTDCMNTGRLEPALLPFHDTWDDLNAKRGYGWLANPWVWVITFKRAEAQP